MMIQRRCGMWAWILAAAVAGAGWSDARAEGGGEKKASEGALMREGFAALGKKEYVAAGRALSQLAPFDVNQSDFALQARYLLGRTHQLSGERPEALAQYLAVVAEWPKARKRAEELMKAPDAISAERREYYQALLKSTPEFISRAMLYCGELQAQSGKNAAAQDLFARLERENPSPEIVSEAKFWHGVCQLQAKNYGEAEKLLRDMVTHPMMGDQARWWGARAKALGADSGGRDFAKIVGGAGEEMLKAADVAAASGRKGDKEAGIRAADILLDAGDTFVLGRHYARAAEVYAKVATEYKESAPDRAEQALEREVSALHLAGGPERQTAYDASDAVARTFESTYPKSTLRAAVIFRQAENDYMRAIAAVDARGEGMRKRETEFLAAASKHYERVIQEYPDFSLISTARAGLGTCQYRMGSYAAAAKTLSDIPDAERVGDLAGVSYLLGDCLLRALPETSDDALSASMLLDDGGRAAKLFVTFAAGNEKHPQFVDALFKAALCLERVGEVTADPLERRKNLAQARDMLDRAAATLGARRNPTAKDQSDQSFAIIERAKVNGLLGDASAAMNDLRTYLRQDKLKDSADAPLAALRLSAFLRAAGKPAEAVELMAQIRGKFEAGLLKSPAGASTAGMLAFEHAVALKESGHPAEARAIFETLARQQSRKAEGANAMWRTAQCRRETIAAQLDAARKSNAAAQIETALQDMRQTVDLAVADAEALKASFPEAASRAFYEAAWAARVVADADIDAARAQAQAAYVERFPGKPADRAALRGPDVPLQQLAIQPSEVLVRSLYERGIEVAPESAFSAQIRFELSEILSRRGEVDTAIEHLVDALAQDPAEDLADRIRVRVASCLVARGGEPSANAALGYSRAVLRNNRTTARGEALLVTAQAYIATRQWQSALETLASIRDNSAFRQIAGVSDLAFLLLSHVQQQLNRPDEARVTLEQFVSAYPSSTRMDDARFALAQAYQQQKRLDQAVNTYTEITRRVYSPTSVRAQLQIGLIRIEQRNYKEAVTALVALGRPTDDPEVLDQTKKALAQVVKDAPKGEWSAAAEKRLQELR